MRVARATKHLMLVASPNSKYFECVIAILIKKNPKQAIQVKKVVQELFIKTNLTLFEIIYYYFYNLMTICFSKPHNIILEQTD